MKKTKIWKLSILLLSMVFIYSCSSEKDIDESIDPIEEQVPEIEQEPFVTTWKTDDANDGVVIYTNPDYISECSYSVDWGDGTATDSVYTKSSIHKYEEPGIHTVKITGNFPAIYNIESSFNAGKLQSIESWGTIKWQSMENAFWNCSNLVINPNDSPNLESVTSMRSMFHNALSFNSDLSDWDVSHVTNMISMFHNALSFNSDLSGWDVSHVDWMSSMFSGATSFNGDLSTWDVSNLFSMRSMFYGATSFNGDLSGWDVSNVRTMSRTFYGATSFNGDLSTWDVSHVTDMGFMFHNASSFNNDLSGWDVGNVTYCTGFSTGSALGSDDLPTLGCFE